MMDGRDCKIMGIISADKSINENSGRLEIQYHKTKIGELVLGSYDSKLCLLDFRYRKMRFSVDNRLKKTLNAKFVVQDNKILKETRKQIAEYLMAERKIFDLPILYVGSDFQKQVWDALLKINYGETASYLDIAKYIGNEKAVRAVASANGANAIAVIIPCHRIIGSNGELVGYGGGLPIKKRLLNLEEKHSKLANHL
jgi:methylated-DNA-[protein]-cysteine S-methyltransferase